MHRKKPYLSYSALSFSDRGYPSADSSDLKHLFRSKNRPYMQPPEATLHIRHYVHYCPLLQALFRNNFLYTFAHSQSSVFLLEVSGVTDAPVEPPPPPPQAVRSVRAMAAARTQAASFFHIFIRCIPPSMLQIRNVSDGCLHPAVYPPPEHFCSSAQRKFGRSHKNAPRSSTANLPVFSFSRRKKPRRAAAALQRPPGRKMKSLVLLWDSVQMLTRGLRSRCRGPHSSWRRHPS